MKRIIAVIEEVQEPKPSSNGDNGFLVFLVFFGLSLMELFIIGCGTGMGAVMFILTGSKVMFAVGFGVGLAGGCYLGWRLIGWIDDCF